MATPLHRSNMVSRTKRRTGVVAKSRFKSSDNSLYANSIDHSLNEPSISLDEGLANPDDSPLDDFWSVSGSRIDLHLLINEDQELLAQHSGQFNWGCTQKDLLKSFPPSQNIPSENKQSAQDLIQGDSYAFPQTPNPTSPSSALFSSPSISFLKKREYNRAILSRTNQHETNTDSGYQTNERLGSNQQDFLSKIRAPRAILGHAPPIIQGIQLVATTNLPDQMRSIFKFDLFNAVQSKCFDPVFESDDNFVLSAPTGSGKTAVLELAICRLISTCETEDFKIIYQAPTKSLCAERYRDWQAKFATLNLRCAELTGDTDYSHLRSVQTANIIITTPEKWDSVTRKWRDHAKLMQLVKLFLVDEVHILKESRGAALEAVVSRMKSIGSHIRFVALSATIPNPEDIAAWLGKNPYSQHLSAHKEIFGEEFRPVKLEKHVFGLRLPSVIARYGRGKPTMIFCTTRNAATKTAKSLAELRRSSLGALLVGSDSSRQVKITNTELSNTFSSGVAFHHAGLDPNDRQAVEKGFLEGQVQIICSTSTLALGVNLPCYLVILKGTVAYADNGLQEYSDLDVMQMLGRAGRPQFETSACAVILTQNEKVNRYQKMVSGQETLESCLHQNLIEHLNAEIGLGTIHDMKSASQWLGSTFLSVRLRRNPGHYHFDENLSCYTHDDLINQLCKNNIDLLQNSSLVEAAPRLKCTEFGDAMARYYVKFATMKSFIKLAPKAKTSEILSAIAQAAEFLEIRMKAGEKSFYKEINASNDIKFPINVDVALQAHKVSLIIQTELGNVPLPNADKHRQHLSQHNIDKTIVFAHANRLIRCLIDCQLYLEDAVSARHALELGRSFAARVWDNTASQLRQLEGVGDVAARKLAAAGINSIEALILAEAHRIELILGKAPPYGGKMVQMLTRFPNLRISVSLLSKELISGKRLKLKIKAEVAFLNNITPTYFKRKPIYVCFLVETSDGRLLDFRRFASKKIQNGEEILFVADLVKPTSHVICYTMCDEIAGTCKSAELKLHNLWPENVPTFQFKTNREPSAPYQDYDLVERQMENTEEFPEDGLNDQDLLSIEDADIQNTTIPEIDETNSTSDPIEVDLSTQSRKCEAKHSSTPLVEDQDTLFAEYREPIQLSNGRWTCQHDCVTKGKHCKHKCCREGVAYPKRRPKSATQKIGQKDSQCKLAPIGLVPQKRSRNEVQDDESVQVLKNFKFSSTKTPRDTSRYIGNVGFDCERNRNQQERRFSRRDLSENCHKIIEETSLYHSPQNPESTQAFSRRPKEHWLPEVSTNADISNVKPKQTSQSISDKIDMTDFWDWSSSDTLASPSDNVIEDHFEHNPTEPFQETVREVSRPIANTDESQLGNSDGSLDGAAQNRLFEKSHNEANRSHEGNGKNLQARFAQNSEQTCGFEITSNIPEFTADIKQHKEADGAGSESDSKCLATVSAFQAKETVETPSVVVSADHGSQTATIATCTSQSQEGQPEVKGQSHEDEQRKKWAGLDPWLYEQFHNCIDII